MDYESFAQDVVQSAMRAGAAEAEVFLQTGEDFHVSVRKGDVETLTQAGSKGLGLRVFVDKRLAFASTTDFDKDTLGDMVKTTVQLAKAANRDRYNGLPEVGQGVATDLKLYDASIAKLPADTKIEMAREAEKAAFDYDPRITNSEGGSFASDSGTRVIANSNGVLYSNRGTSCDITAVPIAEQDGQMQVGYYYTAGRFLNQLESPSEVGRLAGKRTVEKLGATKVETQKAPVVFDWMVATVLWGSVFGALDGDSAHRGLSFLKRMIGKRIASPIVTLIDDPLMPRGIGSMPFDGEGVLAQTKVVVENGILEMYFYDARTGRKYGHKPTGNARRGFSSLPSVAPANFYLKPTDTSPEEIIRGIGNGFYVTDTIGRGINGVTGDFSVGASGMWIRDGEPAFPVQEVTIAGNMLDMMKNVEAIANDAKFMSTVVSPTFKISEMTISGK
jgi:PmbA protein